MKTKTFKIGEYAIGGIIKVKVRPRNVYEIQALDWDTKEIVKWQYAYGLDNLQEVAEDLSTSYHAELICNYFRA